MRCVNCSNELSPFDVNCRGCGAAQPYKSASEQWAELGFEAESSAESQFIVVEEHSEGGVPAMLRGAGTILGGVASGLAAGAGDAIKETGKQIAADSGLQTADGYAQQKRIERAIRDSRD